MAQVMEVQAFNFRCAAQQPERPAQPDVSWKLGITRPPILRKLRQARLGLLAERNATRRPVLGLVEANDALAEIHTRPLQRETARRHACRFQSPA